VTEFLHALAPEVRSLPRDEVGWYKKYGVTFRDVYPGDLDLLRQWRNHPDIRRAMVFQAEITEEMQRDWYASTDPARDRYSIVHFRNDAIGLTQLRHIDTERRSAEGGIVIWRPEHQNGLLPYRVAIAGMDWDFLERGFTRLTATVLKSNSRARRFVRSLGYVLRDPDPAGEVLLGEVDPERYFRAAASLRRVIEAEMTELAEPFPIGG